MLRPSDILLYEARTLREAGLIGWLADWGTVLAQRIFCVGALGLYDGFHLFRHAAIVVDYHMDLCALEWKPGGMFLTPIHKLKDEAGRLKVLPLNDEYAARFDRDKVAQWIDAHRNFRYRWGGLVFAILHRWAGGLYALLRGLFGWRARKAFFCSEAVVTLLQDLTIVPFKLPCVRRRKVVWLELPPHAYSPSELGQLPQTARARMFTWNPVYFD